MRERPLEEIRVQRRRMNVMLRMLSDGEVLTDELKQELIEIYQKNPDKVIPPLRLYVKGLLETL